MKKEIASALEAVLFAAGESVPIARLSLVLGVDEEEIVKTVDELGALYKKEKRGLRILHLDDKAQMCSSPEHAGVISACLETRKPPMLSPPALETLAVVAYFQPVTRAYIEQVRGVDSSYTVGMLTERGLIEECGRLRGPGPPRHLPHDGRLSAHHGRHQALGAAAPAGGQRGRGHRKAPERH